MNLTAFVALVRRDLRLFFMDQRAVTMSFAAPIVIASFFGYLFAPVSSGSGAASRIKVAAINLDEGVFAPQVIAGLTADTSLEVQSLGLADAREAVRVGKSAIAIVFPAGFSLQAGRAFFRGSNKPEIQLLYDPSHGAEMQMVRGVLTQYVMEVVSREAINGPSSQQLVEDGLRSLGTSGAGANAGDTAALRQMLQAVGAWNRSQQNRSQPNRSQPNSAVASSPGGFSMPYTVSQEAVTAHQGVSYNSMAHSFAGMCVQFILFMGIDAGMVVLAQRRTGIWKRLQAAPLSRFMLISSRAASASIVAMIIMVAVFGFARVVFGVRIEGSFPGFVGVCAAFAVMTATFGLLLSVLGRTPEATRGIAILVTLILVMLGGSWVPAFLFPAWLQKVSFAIPTRWAVGGLDAMIWRGSGFDAAVGPIVALLGFAALFGGVAVWRFRWDTN
jgi:ABC-2 type transport system permease protein